MKSVKVGFAGWIGLRVGRKDGYHVVMSSSKPIFGPAFAPVKTLLEQQIADGLHPGAQLCVQSNGEIIADFAVGEAEMGTGTPLTANSVMPFFSSAWLSFFGFAMSSSIAPSARKNRLADSTD